MSELKNQIIKLRNEGKTYNEIQKQLSCSKGTISYHCQKLNLNESIRKCNFYSQFEKIELNEYQQLWLQRLGEKGVRPSDVADALNIKREFVYKIYKNHNYKQIISEMTSYEKLKRRRGHLKLLAMAYKGCQCEKCGYDGFERCMQAIEFHHKDPRSKDVSPSSTKNWSKLKSELKKCVVLCATCHREVHYLQ